jgi:hypothetical protein
MKTNRFHRIYSDQLHNELITDCQTDRMAHNSIIDNCPIDIGLKNQNGLSVKIYGTYLYDITKRFKYERLLEAWLDSPTLNQGPQVSGFKYEAYVRAGETTRSQSELG